MKALVLLILVAIVVNLFFAMFYLIKGGQGEKMIRSLIWRVSLSIFLFLLLAVGAYFNIITPSDPRYYP